MKILIVSATLFEVKPLFAKFTIIYESNNNFCRVTNSTKSIEFDILISGIGIAFCTYNLTKILQHNNYQLVINVGIAGSFSETIALGEVVFVESDQFADLGIEYEETMLTIFESKFYGENSFPFQNKILCASEIDKQFSPTKPFKATESTPNTRKQNSPFSILNSQLKRVSAITVNRTSGSQQTINERITKFSPQIESMEGAAVFYVCACESVPAIQIRTISNFVIPRFTNEAKNKGWNIHLAINNLNDFMIRFLEE